MAQDNDINCVDLATDIICEFLEAAIHCILYVRSLYPSGIFEMRKKYNVPSPMSVHPELNRYITACLQDIRTLIMTHKIDQIGIVITDGNGMPIEKFIFEIWLPPDSSTEADEYLVEIQQAFREFLLKLNVCDSSLADLPGDCSFIVQVHSTTLGLLSVEDQNNGGVPWVQCDNRQSLIQNAQIVPLKAHSCGLFKVQMYVEH